MRRFGHGTPGLHLTLTVEQDSLFDEERRGVDVATHAARRVNLDASLGHNVATHSALNHDRADRDSLGLRDPCGDWRVRLINQKASIASVAAR